ncbi:SAM-dependent methyltransferase [Prosthecochloris sp. GSB1]|uniref:SAM-dependent methyltransferase n=1 Tax=Prosthecochloris sp. GSB1 TaxID=281093 RepID=UPI001C2BD954|nr:SAM-dependent methyltransferase [Prosthecochloris sp. GSB1]
MSIHFSNSFFLHSIDAWEQDRKERFNLDALTRSFHESVPVLDFTDWRITAVERGYSETVLPLNPSSSNQYITHQAALMLLAADYTGGTALASVFHMTPIIGFHVSENDSAAYMWGAKATIHWFSPSCQDLVCKASIEKNKWEMLARRYMEDKKVITTVPIMMYNGDKLVAKADFTYWAQSIRGLRRNAFDIKKINVLYEHKTKTTAKLIVGLRAMEQEKAIDERLFDDPYAFMLAGKHGITLARRFSAYSPQLQDMVSARTLHLDKTVSSFAQKHKAFNVINIGAGYDSRFWRLQFPNATIYDLDLPIMLNERKRIFDYSKKENINNIEIDITEQPLDEALRKAGFDTTLPSFFIWEGGSMYFREKEIDFLWGPIAKMMNNDSRFWFDYVSEDLVKNTTGFASAENFMKNMRKNGRTIHQWLQRHRKSCRKVQSYCR